ncbi:hypothetical protein FRC10_007273 [Ceratobasidium sp. 414]|nr:hypothetical protein FRC10_007273 [Ceratobasidium sp. 414]
MNEGVEFLGVGVPCGGSVDRFGALGVEEEPEFPLTPHDLAESTPWNVLDMMSTQTSLANPPETKMPENMPVQERQAHRIRAKAVFAGALGTDVATITPGPITYGDLLRRIRLGNKSGRSR